MATITDILDGLTAGEREALGVAGHTRAYKGKRTDRRAGTVSGLVARRLKTAGLVRMPRDINGDRVVLTDTGALVLARHDRNCGALTETR